MGIRFMHRIICWIKHCTVVICSMLYSEQIKKQLEAMHTENEIVIL